MRTTLMKICTFVLLTLAVISSHNQIEAVSINSNCSQTATIIFLEEVLEADVANIRRVGKQCHIKLVDSDR